MPLPAGTRVGPYEILSALGAGGMGEVYRARDTKLRRDVALKFLPDNVRADPDRRARFEREARTLAALNHPHVGAIYGLEDAGGAPALVLELVDGETLDDRLRRGPLPIDECVQLARQITDALEAAHDRQIVHRDLKPANIKVTPEGVVKVLDFGLAKALGSDAGAADPSESPTITAAGTRDGVILGTAAYMSPEQARGRTVDKRADVWAFGCVLFEMLTGRAAFPGDTVSDVIVAVLDRQPDWRALPSDTPAPLLRLLRRSLTKEASRRLRDIADARLELDEAQAGTKAATAPQAAAPALRDIVFQRLTDEAGAKEAPALSPDGKMIAFVRFVGIRRQIWIRLLAGGALLQLTRDDADHLQPRWAPDSNTLIYFTPGTGDAQEGTIWEISALGGWPRRVATAIGGGDVSHDGRRIAAVQVIDDRPALVAVSRDGRTVERMAWLQPGFRHGSPRWSPDDRSVAILRYRSYLFEISVDVCDAGGTEWREVVRASQITGFCWRPDGSGFVYASSTGSTLLYPAVLNLRTVARDGRGDRQLSFGDHSYFDPDCDRTGRLVVARVTSRSDIWRIPIDGSPQDNNRNAVDVTRQRGHVQTPTVNPDGSEVAYVSDTGGHANLWIARTDGSGARQITFETDPTLSFGVPKWSPRGDVIAFVQNVSAIDVRAASGDAGVPARTTGLWAIRPDGSGLRLVANGAAPCWSGDGNWLYYWRLGGSPRRVEKLPIDGGPPVVVREEDEQLILPVVSADGSTLYALRPVKSRFFGSRSPMNEICRARPEGAPLELLLRLPGERFAVGISGWAIPFIELSPDGQWLVTSLADGDTANLWALPTAGGPMKPLTDFGDRSVAIQRSVSWSADSRHIYAAVAENDTHIVSIDGLI
jgi:Tol biopolymer transport system component